MEEINSDIEFLKTLANIIISGATGSGKTYFLLKLLKEWPFKSERGEIYYFYNIWQPLFEEFIATFPDIKFIQGLCLEPLLEKDADDKIRVCICDDLADCACKSEDFARLFTVYGHHKNLLNVFISQNLFLKGPYSTTINRNTHYYVLTKTPHLNAVDTLSRQLYGANGPLRAAYLKTMSDKPYNYILVDVFCDNFRDKMRTNIFSSEKPMIIWRAST